MSRQEDFVKNNAKQGSWAQNHNESALANDPYPKSDGKVAENDKTKIHNVAEMVKSTTRG